MNIYLVVLILLVVLCLFEFAFKTKYTVMIGAVGLALLAGLRASTVGPDTINYVTSYQMLRFGDITSSFEPGFILFERICYLLGLNVTGFLLSFSLISMGLLGVFLIKYSPIPSVSLLYYYARYFLSRDMNQIRQSLATILTLFSIKYIIEKKPIKFSALIIVAAQFHRVALIMFIPYILINYLHFNEKKIFLKYMVLTALSLVFSLLVPTILTRFAGDSVYVSYTGYTQSSGLLNPVLILEVLISIICCFFLARSKGYDYSTKVMMLTYMLGSNVLVMFNQYSVIGGRVSSTLTTFEVILIVKLLTTLSKGLLRYSSLILVSVSVFCVINLYGGAINSYLPYSIYIQ